MGIKNTFKNSLFAKSLNFVKSNPDKAGLIVLFDALFIVFFFILKKFFDFFAGEFPLPTTTAAFYIFILLSLIYYLIVLFVYSFFKYGILHFIRSFSAKSNFSASRLWNFYLLNVIIAGVFVAIMLIFNLALASIKQNYAPYVFIILAGPFILLSYFIINISQSAFYQNASIKQSINIGFQLALSNIFIIVINGLFIESIVFPIFFPGQVNYMFIIALIVLILSLLMYFNQLILRFRNLFIARETIIPTTIAISFLMFIWQIIGYIGKIMFLNDYMKYLTYYSYFTKFSLILITIWVYLIILINRISFYSAINPIKDPK